MASARPQRRSERTAAAAAHPVHQAAASTSTRSRPPSAACSRWSRISRRSSRPTANMPSRRCWSPSSAATAGRFFGRAFDPSQMLGDHCWEVLGELRYDIPTGIKQLTRAQLYAFADHGQVYNIDPAAGTPSTQHGTSAGGGVRVAWEDTYTADLSVAKAVEGPRNDWRVLPRPWREVLMENG